MKGDDALKKILDNNEKTVKKPVQKEEAKPTQKQMLEELMERELELQEVLLVGMPTKAEMQKERGTTHKHLAWEEKNRDNIQEWKRIRRALYMEKDPNTANLENIRPD